jgi:ribosome-associated protein
MNPSVEPSDGSSDAAGDAGESIGSRLLVTRSCSIPLGELRWRTSRSGGPGGQHANTSDTRVEVIFDIVGSPSLGPVQRRRLQERFGDDVRAVASDERSQARNRGIALERLRVRLADGLRVETPRRPTRPTAGSRRRRLEDKRRRSDLKRSRRAPDQ